MDDLEGSKSAIPQKKSLRVRAFGAFSAIYILAAGMPGITIPAQAQEAFGSYSSSEFVVDPKQEARRKQGQEILRKALGSQPKQVEAQMHELLALGPACREKVDRNKLFAMPGAEDMYKKLSDVFMKYNWYIASVSDSIPLLSQPRNPKPSDSNFDGDPSYTFEPDPDAPAEEVNKAISEMRGLGEEIQADVTNVMQYPNVDALMKLLLQEANCLIS